MRANQGSSSSWRQLLCPVRHTRSVALDELEPVLAELRRFNQLGRRRGVRSSGGRDVFALHEDAGGLFADVRLGHGDDFDRLGVAEQDERAALIEAVRRSLIDQARDRVAPLPDWPE